MNKKAFVDPDVFLHPVFWMLALGAIAATVIGYKMSLGMVEEGGGWPLWQLIAIIAVEVVAAYYFVASS